MRKDWYWHCLSYLRSFVVAGCWVSRGTWRFGTQFLTCPRFCPKSCGCGLKSLKWACVCKKEPHGLSVERHQCIRTAQLPKLKPELQRRSKLNLVALQATKALWQHGWSFRMRCSTSNLSSLCSDCSAGMVQCVSCTIVMSPLLNFVYVLTVYPRWEGQVAYKMKTTSPKDYTIKLAPKDVLNCAKKPLPFISVSLRPASGSIRMGEFHDVSPRHVCRGHEKDKKGREMGDGIVRVTELSEANCAKTTRRRRGQP